MFLKTEQSIWGSGKATCVTVTVNRPGLMEPNMQVNGDLIKLMEKVLFGTLQVINMKDNGRMIKHTATEFTLTQMEPSTKATGKKIYSMVGVLKSGLMVQNMKVITFREESTDKVLMCGQMGQDTLAIGLKIKSMGKANTNGLMVVVIRETG